jgi:hypothetical protein
VGRSAAGPAVEVVQAEQVSLRVAPLKLHCVTSRKTSNSAPIAALDHFNAIRIGTVKICVYWGPYWRPWPYW